MLLKDNYEVRRLPCTIHFRVTLEIAVNLPARVSPLTIKPISIEAALISFLSEKVGSCAKTTGKLVVGDKGLAE